MLKITKKLIEGFSQRLKIGDRRGVHLNAVCGKSKYKFDVDRLSILNKDIPNNFIKELLEKNNFNFEISFKKNIKDINLFSEDDQLKIIKISKNLNDIKNQTDTIQNEKGINTFGFGYPLLVRRSEKDRKIIVSPILIWHLEIENGKYPNSWIIKRNENNPIYLNEVLINYLKDDNSISLEKIDDKKLEDGLIDKNELVNISLNVLKSCNLNINEKEISKALQDKLYNISSIESKEYYEKLISDSTNSLIENSGLFSIFEIAKENIITEYDTNLNDLINEELDGSDICNGYFQPISSIETDPSQQAVLASLDKKRNIIIHGPPGTGKSQTLTAILINALENNKKVLVVCEKRTAMDVLYEGLQKKRLNHNSVIIRDIQSDRKIVVDSVRDRSENSEYNIVSKDTLKRHHTEIEKYIKEINKSHTQIGNIYHKNKNWTATIGYFLKERKNLNFDFNILKDLNFENIFNYSDDEFEEMCSNLIKGERLFADYKDLEYKGIINIEKLINNNETIFKLKDSVSICMSEYSSLIEKISKEYEESKIQYSNIIENKINDYVLYIDIKVKEFLDLWIKIISEYKESEIEYLDNKENVINIFILNLKNKIQDIFNYKNKLFSENKSFKDYFIEQRRKEIKSQVDIINSICDELDIIFKNNINNQDIKNNKKMNSILYKKVFSIFSTKIKNTIKDFDKLNYLFGKLKESNKYNILSKISFSSDYDSNKKIIDYCRKECDVFISKIDDIIYQEINDLFIILEQKGNLNKRKFYFKDFNTLFKEKKQIMYDICNTINSLKKEIQIDIQNSEFNSYFDERILNMLDKEVLVEVDVSEVLLDIGKITNNARESYVRYNQDCVNGLDLQKVINESFEPKETIEKSNDFLIFIKEKKQIIYDTNYKISELKEKIYKYTKDSEIDNYFNESISNIVNIKNFTERDISNILEELPQIIYNGKENYLKAKKEFIDNVKLHNINNFNLVSNQKLFTIQNDTQEQGDVFNKFRESLKKLTDSIRISDLFNEFNYNEDIKFEDFITETNLKINKVIEHIEKNSLDKEYLWFKFFNALDKKNKRLIKKFTSFTNWNSLFKIIYIYNLLVKKASDDLICDDHNLKELKNIFNKIESEQIRFINNLYKKEQFFAKENYNNKYSNFTFDNLYSKRSGNHRRLSLREIVQEDIDLFTKFFPIIFTTPDIASNLFKGENDYFDFVLFDEASQLKPEDTLPCLLKGKQIIVAGDEQQMPPSSWFQKVLNETISEDDDEYEINEETEKIQPRLNRDDILLECESLLDFVKELDFTDSFLDFHYRSKHPYLIDFSNYAFYKQRLNALPSYENYTPIEFIHLSDAVKIKKNTDNKGTNEKEIEEILNILDKKINKDKTGKYPSVGIATFNIQQRDLIIKKILERKESSKFEDFNKKITELGLDELKSNKGFIKNVDNIQGDEKDIIIISTTFAKDEDGKFTQNFGPITQGKGYRILNVLITRAKEKIYCVSSIPLDKISTYKDFLGSEGIKGKAIFYSYLAYCKAVSENNEEDRKSILLSIAEKTEKSVTYSNIDETESPFEEEVYQVLVQEFGSDNITLQEKVGGFRIDIVYKKNNNLKIAIECDGAKYHSSNEAYLYDLHRQRILESYGYKFIRIWSTNWWQNFDLESKNLINKIKSMI